MELDLKKLKEKIGFIPTEQQSFILKNLKRFNVIVGGRRTGKSYLVAYILLRELLAGKRRIWLVAPSYSLGKVVWNYLLEWSNRYFPALLNINKAELTITNNVTGSVLELKSADSATSLKGVGLDLLILDESADIPEDIFERYLLPNISEKRAALGGELGRAVLIGNSSRIGSYFHRFYKMEMDDKFSYHLPTVVEENGRIVASNNPEIITLEELKRIKETTSTQSWRQNFLAAFISGQGQVFRNIEQCIKDTLSAPKAGSEYLMGVDLGRKRDYSCITVIDKQTFELVYFDRFKELDWKFQKLKIVETSTRYNRAKIAMDATGIGDTIVNDLHRSSTWVEAMVFNNENKKDMIEKLVIFIEQNKISFPNLRELISELEAFEYKVSQTGRILYSAPANLHDDTVISLALAVKNLPNEPIKSPTKFSPIQHMLSRKPQNPKAVDKTSDYL